MRYIIFLDIHFLIKSYTSSSIVFVAHLDYSVRNDRAGRNFVPALNRLRKVRASSRLYRIEARIVAQLTLEFARLARAFFLSRSSAEQFAIRENVNRG